MKKPTKKTLNSIEMIKIMESIPKNDSNLQYIDEPAGKEHYRLLVWLGGQVKGNMSKMNLYITIYEGKTFVDNWEMIKKLSEITQQTGH